MRLTAPVPREPKKIVEEMVVTYGLYENAANERVGELLAELDQKVRAMKDRIGDADEEFELDDDDDDGDDDFSDDLSVEDFGFDDFESSEDDYE